MQQQTYLISYFYTKILTNEYFNYTSGTHCKRFYPKKFFNALM